MQKRIITVKNSAGIHCRPSSVIITAINQEFPFHHFELEVPGNTVEINSMLALISLGLCCGSTAELRVEGPDEEKAVQRIGDLLEHEFDFPPR